MTIGKYKYLFADLKTGSELGEIPMTNVSYTRKLNDSGQWAGTVPLGYEQDRIQNVIDSCAPGRTVAYIERSGVIDYGGIVWGRSYNSVQRKMTLSGESLESYLSARFITNNLSFVKVDQLDVARALINYMQGKPSGSIALTYDTALSGVLRVRDQEGQYNAFSTAPIFDALRDLSALVDGFDFRIDCTYNATHQIQRILRLGYPRLGIGYLQTQFTFEYPGNIIDYTYSEDAFRAATVVWEVGQNSSVFGPVRASKIAQDLLDLGYPLIEKSISGRSNIVSYNALAGYAAEDIRINAVPHILTSVTVRGGSVPLIGSYQPGDEVIISLNDPARFSRHVSFPARIVSYTVNIPDDGSDETISLELGPTGLPAGVPDTLTVIDEIA